MFPAAALAAFTLLTLSAAAPAGGEIFVGSGNAILVFANDADGNIAPLREIAGLQTELPSVFTLLVDRVHRELWVSGFVNTILVFSLDDVGDVPPRRKIEGASTGLTSPRGMVLDLMHDELYVVDSAGAVRVFPRLADGDVAPTRLISGAATGLASPVMGFLDLIHDELYISNSSGTGPRIRIFARTASGEMAPLRTLGTPGSGIANPRGLLVDLEHDELIVVEHLLDAVRFYSRTAIDSDSWLREIAGLSTQLDLPYQATLTENDELLIGNDGDIVESFVGHARTAQDNATPTRHVSGNQTFLDSATGIASDRAKNCSEGNSVDGCIYRDNFEANNVCYWSSAVGSPACP